jgi:hypothetical protein
VFDPGDRPHEWEILIRLTGLCTGTPAEDVHVAAIDDGFFDYLAFTQGLDGAAIRKLYDHGGPERILDLTLRTGPFGDRYGANPGGLTLDMLKAHPNGIDFGPMVPQLPDILGIPEKKSGSPRRTCSMTCRGWPRASSAQPSHWSWSAADTCDQTTRGCTTCPR